MLYEPAVYCLMSQSKRIMYIGSTTQSTRFSKHKSHYKRYMRGSVFCKWYSAFALLECDDVEFHIIRQLDGGNDRADLYKLESQIIKDFKNACIYAVVNKKC